MSEVRTHRRAEQLTLGMADARAERSAGLYRDKVVTPLRGLVDAVDESGGDVADARRLLESMGADVLESFDNDGLAEEFEAHVTQSMAVGAATAPVVKGSR